MMNSIDRNITDIIDTEYWEYAMYSVENRAIPSYIDGMKPVQRKLLYSMLNDFKNKKVKVAELASSISKYGYHHGEGGAAGASVTLACDWNNNIPIFHGHGNFGSRLINDSAAARYIFVTLSKNFNKYFTDFDVCNKHKDIEYPEPQQYLPLIPWVLVNGIKGIAVGFACEYFPHNTLDIINACLLEADNKLNDDFDIRVSFPDFRGIINTEGKRTITTGLIKNIKKNIWQIDELPWGYDREKYFNILDKLSMDKKIISFDDLCDSDGFKFSVKVNPDYQDLCKKNPIEFFKLEKSNTQNFVALNEIGELITFDNQLDIIRRFVKFRINKVEERIKFEISDKEYQSSVLSAKIKFINEVINGTLVLLDYTRSQLIDYIVDNYTVNNDIATSVVGLPMYSMTSDSVDLYNKKLKELLTDLDKLKKSNAKTVYKNQLKQLLK